MSIDPRVLARARARVLGTPSVSVREPVPAGAATASDGERVWLLPRWPDGATPALLEEYDTAPMPFERGGQARRVLAAALRCCWTRPDDAPWPGSPAAVADVLEVYAGMTRGTELARRWATGELRRLSETGWLLLDEASGTVRPGPRVALWADGSLTSLRALLHTLPQPPHRSSPSSPPPENPEHPSMNDPAVPRGRAAEKSAPVDDLPPEPGDG
ncbi:hypothetical protein [Spirillospora albida]|uniref:hypothetical protein n=1 Tax=Spirillospora albida TaxID=58123 RepID=UPI000A7E1D07|nr:hypothetical protein [Spirillospora albida]